MTLQMTAEEIAEFLDEVFPQVTGQFIIEDLAEMQIRVRLKVGPEHLRPGGTVSARQSLRWPIAQFTWRCWP